MEFIRRIRSMIRTSYKLNYTMLLSCLAAAMLMFGSGQANASLSMNANHDHIEVDFFYHGSTVTVSGEADAGTELVIKISSPYGHEKLKKKGKAGGFLWMNVGDLNLEETPSLYFLHSTKELSGILTPEEMDRYVLGYPAVKDHAEIHPVEDEAEKTKWFNEFIRFKEESNLYTTSSGDINITEENGRQSFRILCDWPYQALPGDYTVTVYAVKNNKVVEKAEHEILVEQVGVEKSLFNMANNNGATYGIVSIIVALGAGFGVGMIFGKDGGAH